MDNLNELTEEEIDNKTEAKIEAKEDLLQIEAELISQVTARTLVADFFQETRKFVLTICSIIIVMPKISSQIIGFTKYWHLLALDLFLLLALCCY